ncbi:K+ channel tetramerization domain protein, partial [Gregarina niphandrodes]
VEGDLAEAMKRIEEENRRVRNIKLSQSRMVEFNVGGQLFQTSRSTVESQRGSLLCDLISGRHEGISMPIFIDRDPALFSLILNFLRNPYWLPIARDITESERLALEAQYFRLEFLPFPLAVVLGGHDGVTFLNDAELIQLNHFRKLREPPSSPEDPKSSALMQVARTTGGKNTAIIKKNILKMNPAIVAATKYAATK